MQTLVFTSLTVAALGLAACGLAACGGKVVVDGNPDGQGGAGGTGSTSSLPTTTTTTAITTSVTTTVTSGPSTVQSSVSSVSTGPSSCDETGDCFACQECSLGPGACGGLYSDCLNDTDCGGLLDCFNGCQDIPECYDKCLAAFPGAEEPYNELVICVLCKDCYFSCDGGASGCP